jgi:uncharacterized membrane protein HdeD (DUF308 family)
MATLSQQSVSSQQSVPSQPATPGGSLVESLSRALVLRGVLALVIGAIALFAPLATLTAIAVVFAVYAFADGAAALVTGARALRHHARAWPHFAQGVLGVAAGIVALLFPPVTIMMLILVIAVWALVVGYLEITAAVRLRRVRGEWIVGLYGLLAVVFGALLVFRPTVGLAAVPALIGVYAVTQGVLLCWLGVRVRRLPRDTAA